jgi:hypothetical protein
MGLPKLPPGLGLSFATMQTMTTHPMMMAMSIMRAPVR